MLIKKKGPPNGNRRPCTRIKRGEKKRRIPKSLMPEHDSQNKKYSEEKKETSPGNQHLEEEIVSLSPTEERGEEQSEKETKKDG